MVDALVEHGIDVVLLWSIWPETYSFTFFEALAAGCFVITNRNSGNIQAQVRQWNCGRVFDTESEMLRFLSDSRRVSSALTDGHRQRGKRFRLRFNPEIAETIKNTQRKTVASAHPADAGANRHRLWLDNWFAMFVKRSASERLKHEELRRREDELNRLRAQLAVYRSSLLHRLAENFRKWWQGHPHLSRYCRPLFVRLSQPLIHIFRR
jgi:hypothetical protein